MKKIKIDNNLYSKLEETGKIKGYSSTDEFILHLLENAVSELEDAVSEEEVRKRLKGLNYLK